MERSRIDKLFEGKKRKKRCNSIGCIDEMIKREREEMKRSKGEEDEI